MAKSLRSKVKRSFRNKKREEGVYAATEAARLQRLNSKLRNTIERDADGDVEIADEADSRAGDLPAAQRGDDGERIEGGEGEDAAVASSMDVDSASKAPSTKRVSTHGPRGSRREEWRLSKGMTARPQSKGLNRQGGIAARNKPGRPKRRR
ncbi:hypothetical protein BD626DRAFT_481526 [Schizophyllum amplum]|uniref:DUF2423 domain-containing protein n=1 Tax=Schizophyllum amplum TaxID=97359 RepID=A0A550CUB3_9AGAR|nr:hypothetical protein BD626DRAFT_481526 [Auriculariopsis ampla]